MNNKDKQKNIKIAFIIAGILLFLLFIVTRLWQLMDLPLGLHADEVGMGYDAWCIANFGVDRYMKSFPVYFLNYGDGQNALYTYLCAALFKIMGFHTMLLRAPAIIFSFINVIFGAFLSLKMFPEKKWMSLITSLFVIICPYFIMAARFGLESSLMLGVSGIFLYCLIKAIDTDKTIACILSGIFGGIILYTYAISYIVLPLFLIFTLAHTMWCKKLSFKKCLSIAVPMGILSLPLILVQIVNVFDLPEMKLGIFTITKFSNYRASEVAPLGISGIVNMFRTVFIGDWLTYNSVPEFPNLYLITILLFAVGFVSFSIKFAKSIKNKVCKTELLIYLWFIAAFAAGCMIDANNNRINAIFLSAVLIAVEGINVILTAFRQLHVKQIILTVILAVYLISFGSFYKFYFGGTYSDKYNPLPYFDLVVDDAIEFIKENPGLSEKEVWMPGSNPMYFAVDYLPSPYEYDFENAITHDSSYGVHYNLMGCYPDPDINANIIVPDTDEYYEYMNALREYGYTEKAFSHYILFYQ